MSQLTDALSALSGVTIGQDAMKQLNAAVPAASRWGSSIEDYLAPRMPKEYQRVFWDANKDNPLGATNYVNTQIGRAEAGQNPWSDTEYNQNIAKRAAMVAAVFGGAALAGGAGAGSAAAGAGEAGAGAAGAGETGAVAAGGGAAGGGTVAPTTAYGIGAGNVGGATLSGTAGGTAGTYTPVMSAAGPTAAGGGGAGVAAAGGSWGPYAQAGGTILSTLFQGLMQMEQAKEQRDMEIRMAKAKANIERAQAENAALDRLIQIWGRRA